MTTHMGICTECEREYAVSSLKKTATGYICRTGKGCRKTVAKVSEVHQDQDDAQNVKPRQTYEVYDPETQEIVVKTHTPERSTARDDWQTWRMVKHNDSQYAYVASNYDLTSEDYRNATVTAFIAEPVVTSGKRQLVCFILAEYEFNAGEGAQFYSAVAIPKPYGYEGLGSLPIASTVNDVRNGEYAGVPREYVIQRKISTVTDPETKERTQTESYHVLLDHVVTVSRAGLTYSIRDDRRIKQTSNSLAITVNNMRDAGTVTQTVNYQDTVKSIGQAEWYSKTLIALDVQKVNYTHVAEYLRTRAKAASFANLIDGLGPVIDNGRTIFIAGNQSFDIDNGQSAEDYELSTDKEGIRQFGLTFINDRKVIADGYTTLARLLDTCPPRPYIPAAMLGIVAISPLSTLYREYRTLVYLHGRPGAGKTSLAYLMLGMQSHNTRGYDSIKPTVSLRKGRGGSTTNGSLMVLQYAGGFCPLLDDFIQLQAGPRDVIERHEGLSVMLGALEGAAPVKQNWGKAGPEFATSFAPQGSYIISAERPVSMQSEGILRRIVELEAPDTTFGDPNGFNASLMKELDKPESMDLIHYAYSDMVRWQLQNQDTVASMFESATDEVGEWSEIDNVSMRRNYAKAVLGLRVIQHCALLRGVDLSTRIDVAVKELRDGAVKQYRQISLSKVDFRSSFLKTVHDMLIDRKICITGEPDSSRDWTDPFTGRSDIDESYSDEESTSDVASTHGLTRSQLGLKWINKAWSTSGAHIGYFRSPKSGSSKGGNSNILGGKAYVWLTSDQLGTLRRTLEAANELDPMDDRTFRKRLIDERVAIAALDGGPNHGAKRSLRIAASDLWPDEKEED